MTFYNALDLVKTNGGNEKCAWLFRVNNGDGFLPDVGADP